MRYFCQRKAQPQDIKHCGSKLLASVIMFCNGPAVRSFIHMESRKLQVLGHTKTILVLLGGYFFLGDQISARQAAGMALAVFGMISYGMATAPRCVCV